MWWFYTHGECVVTGIPKTIKHSPITDQELMEQSPIVCRECRDYYYYY